MKKENIKLVKRMISEGPDRGLMGWFIDTSFSYERGIGASALDVKKGYVSRFEPTYMLCSEYTEQEALEELERREEEALDEKDEQMNKIIETLSLTCEEIEEIKDDRSLLIAIEFAINTKRTLSRRRITSPIIEGINEKLKNIVS